MSKLEVLSTEEKALSLNLQPSIYGVFAEIGAGQEVANHFFKAGAASGTIAKTISAYDMTVSDSIYGRTKKYVSKERVQSMLNVEYEKLITNLASKAPMTHFFVFANSIETINYNKTNNGQGWIGIKFQLTPNSHPATCLIHIIFHTKDVNEQRRIIGDFGVNLIYSAYEYHANPELFVENLKQNLNTDYFEINFIELSGERFKSSSSLELSLQLVRSGLTKMIMLGKDGQILSPSNALYKKDVLLNRGRFRPPTKITEEMFSKSQQFLLEEDQASRHNILPVAEITFRCFQEHKELTLNDFMMRYKLVAEMNVPLMITNFTYHHELITFLNSYTKMNSLNIILGQDNLRKVMTLNSKGDLEQKMLRLITAMTSGSCKILAFPELNKSNGLSSINDLNVPAEVVPLFNFLKTTGRISEIPNVNKDLLTIKSDAVLQAIVANQPWEEMVPEQIVPVIQESNQIKSISLR